MLVFLPLPSTVVIQSLAIAALPTFSIILLSIVFQEQFTAASFAQASMHLILPGFELHNPKLIRKCQAYIHFDCSTFRGSRSNRIHSAGRHCIRNGGPHCRRGSRGHRRLRQCRGNNCRCHNNRISLCKILPDGLQVSCVAHF